MERLEQREAAWLQIFGPSSDVGQWRQMRLSSQTQQEMFSSHVGVFLMPTEAASIGFRAHPFLEMFKKHSKALAANQKCSLNPSGELSEALRGYAQLLWDSEWLQTQLAQGSGCVWRLLVTRKCHSDFFRAALTSLV